MTTLTDHDLQFIERIEQDELFYPLITMNDEYVADGYIQTKQIHSIYRPKACE